MYEDLPLRQQVNGKESICKLIQIFILKLWEFAHLFAARRV